jgi:hypothetical protein
MDISTEELNLNCQVQDFEHVYIKQEEQLATSSTFMITKNEDKVKYIILGVFLHFSRTLHVSF